MLASYKLHFLNARVRVVVAGFDGPGADLFGDEANEAFAKAGAMLAWVEERERGLRVRSMSVDLVARRALVTFDVGGSRPIVVRVDEPAATDLLGRGRELEAFLEDRARAAFARR